MLASIVIVTVTLFVIAAVCYLGFRKKQGSDTASNPSLQKTEGTQDPKTDSEYLARRVILWYEKNDLNSIQSFFDDLEAATSTDGEKLLRDVIELIQNIASQRSYGYSVFEPFLGTRSKSIWREVEIEWEGVSTLADMVRKEKGLPLKHEFIDINQIGDIGLKSIIEASQRKHS